MTMLVTHVLHVFHVRTRTTVELAENKRYYGTVTVSERGQISIPAQARRDFDIRLGEKLLVLGNLEKGIVLTTVGIMSRMMAATLNGVTTA